MPRTKRRRQPATADDARLIEVLRRLEAGEALAGMELSGLRLVGEDLGSYPPADFSCCDLRGAHFERLNLSRASFAESNLSGASFRTVDLSRADLGKCSARGALFSDVNLAYAGFPDSDLRGSILFEANMADVSFKGASLDGAEIEAIRLSLNGGTHVLGLKEALRALADERSYPYIAGISGDCFWMTYYLKTRDLNWGGFAKDVLRRGLENFGFGCTLVNEVDEEAAWDGLRKALADGQTVITPLHVSKATILGSGFGGAEWVFVTGIDRGEVLVNCLLGDGMRFSRERFLRGWCMHHPHEEAAEDLPIIYAMCVVGPRERTPSRTETVRNGLAAAVEISTLEPREKVCFGFDAYQCLIEDLSSAGPDSLPPEEVRHFLPWSGVGLLHHHGSRWAVRDFIDEVLQRGGLSRTDTAALAEARDLYGEACTHLQRILETVPWTFDGDDPRERDEAVRAYRSHHEEASDRLRSAAALERDALERFKAVLVTD